MSTIPRVLSIGFMVLLVPLVLLVQSSTARTRTSIRRAPNAGQEGFESPVVHW